MGMECRQEWFRSVTWAVFFEERFIPYSAAAGEGVFRLYPLPNNGQGPFGTNTYSQVRPNRGSGHMLSAKIDWEISTQDTFTARYNFTDDESVIPFTGDSINSSIGTDTRTQNLSTYLNSVRNSFTNLARLSYGRTRLGFPPDTGSPLLFGSPPSGDLPPEVSQVIETPYGRFGPFGATGPVGQVSILPFSSVGIDVFNFPQGRVDNTFPPRISSDIWIPPISREQTLRLWPSVMPASTRRSPVGRPSWTVENRSISRTAITWHRGSALPGIRLEMAGRRFGLVTESSLIPIWVLSQANLATFSPPLFRSTSIPTSTRPRASSSRVHFFWSSLPLMNRWCDPEPSTLTTSPRMRLRPDSVRSSLRRRPFPGVA